MIENQYIACNFTDASAKKIDNDPLQMQWGEFSLKSDKASRNGFNFVLLIGFELEILRLPGQSLGSGHFLGPEPEDDGCNCSSG